jgi:hypothetical protein
MNRNARRVGRDDRAWTPNGLDLLDKRALDVDLLDNGLENPVDVGEPATVGINAARRNQCGCIRRKERIRLEAARALQPVACNLGRHVEQ